MPETIIESVLTGKIDTALLIKWLSCDEFEDTPEGVLLCCSRSEFVAHFLSYLRNQTDSILQANSNAIQLHQSTPEKIINARRKHRRSISDPTSDDRNMDSLTVKTDKQRSHESPSKDKKRTGRRVKTKLFTDDKKEQSISSDESRLSTGVDRLVLSSTPIKNGVKATDYPSLPLTSPVTPNRSFREYERCDTPRLSHRHSRSHEKSCLGDYLVNVQKSSKKKKSKNTSNEEADKTELDISNSEIFPEIGVRKSSSLRSERRRIKPTNIDRSTSQKSFSLNSFNSECFQQPSPLALEDNAAFKHQNIQPKESTNSFETERNILKLERHKLMEKFNILNTSASPKPVVTPQIKVIHKDSFEKSLNYIKSDCTKVLFKEKIDILIDIYDVLLKNNLILSIITEIYFLISILLSKQTEEDYFSAESNLNDNNFGYLLKSIHNSTYFAVKSLWNLKVVLEVILDKTSLKILGENKKIRSFYPDLAKFLLNSYGLKCEADSMLDKKTIPETRPSNGVICFNLETDNVDNFPSAISFQNFKKQRDMFYEILRWYQETQSMGSSRTSFRARIKTLLSCGQCPANYSHLATLFVAHMLSECLPANTQESKLSKLQRRLTCPTAPESHRLPYFSAKELFYKEFITHTDNESFRVHLRDAIASEITALDAVPLVGDDRANSNTSDLSKDYLHTSKKLGLLAKFLGFLASLPYTQVIDYTSKVVRQLSREQNYAPPKDKVFESNLTLRNYSQPCIDLKYHLSNAYKNSRLCLTIPWIVLYLSMLDYTSLRIKYYKEMIKTLFEIYVNRLKLNDNKIKKNTVIFLKSILGWLFDLPHFPIELFHECCVSASVITSDINIDCCDVIDESILFELCPYLRDVNVLLSTCRVSNDQKDVGSFRHITPVSLSLNAEDRIRNKEKELQARLEEELLKSQPSSTRRVLELVIERVTSGCVRELTTKPLAEARERAREHAGRLVRTRGEDSKLLQSLQALYTEQLQNLRSSALEYASSNIRSRSNAALTALLPAAPAPLHALAVKGCMSRLNKWIHDNWSTTAILCKDIEAELKTLVCVGEGATPSPRGAAAPRGGLLAAGPHFLAHHVSPAQVIINLKEHICQLLEYEETSDLDSLLHTTAVCCSPNNIFSRQPTQRAILQLSVDLCIVFVSRKPKEVDEDFLNKLHAVWNTCCPDRKRTQTEEILLPERRPELSPEFRNFEDDERAPTPISDEETDPKPIIIITNEVSNNIEDIKNEGNKNEVTEIEGNRNEVNTTVTSVIEENNEGLLEFFDRILCPRNIAILSDSDSVASEVWEGLATVLVFLLKNDYLSEDSLTEQCLAVYRQDWPQSILENLSTCMKSVSSRWSRSSTGKFTLFLDFLAEYCGDMEYEPVE